MSSYSGRENRHAAAFPMLQNFVTSCLVFFESWQPVPEMTFQDQSRPVPRQESARGAPIVQAAMFIIHHDSSRRFGCILKPNIALSRRGESRNHDSSFQECRVRRGECRSRSADSTCKEARRAGQEDPSFVDKNKGHWVEPRGGSWACLQ